jgi:hypothetical protein
MDDNFLYQLQEQPDSGFANDLHRKLEQDHPEPNRWLHMNFYNLIRSKRLVQVTALLVISIIAIMAISPARAFVSSLIANIAGQLFEVTEDYPGDNYPGDEEIIKPQVMSLGEALAVFPYDVNLPSNVPSEYVLNKDTVRVYVGGDAGPFANTIEFEWLSEDHTYLVLRVTDNDQIIGEIVAPDSVEEVLLDANHSAVLIRGGWEADNKVWNNEVGFRLRWSVDNLAYDLMGVNREQLIDIALSTLK